MRLAILETDILRDALRPRYEGYGRMFVELFERVGVDWEMTVYSVINGAYPQRLDDYDGFLITGSQQDAFADTDWIVQLRQFVQQLYREGRPLVGICFGHQLLAHALGGEAGRASAGWGLGVMEFQVEQSAAFLDSDEPVKLIVSHQDQVLRIPDEAQVLLRNDFCPLAAFYIPGRVLALQGHPEFSVEYARALLAYRREQISREHLDRVESSFGATHEGERVGRWIKQFIEGAVR